MSNGNSFNGAYKTWRNRARRHDVQSIVRMAMQSLQTASRNSSEDFMTAPWLTLLLVKWVCQDRRSDRGIGQPITISAFNDLRQRLWMLPDQTSPTAMNSRSGQLLFRQILRSQAGFQKAFTISFMREAALLLNQPSTDPLRRLFENKTNIGLDVFLDLTFATYGALLDGKRKLDISWYQPLRTTYTDADIAAYVSCVSRTYPELLSFFRGLPHADQKYASEFYEFPVLSRYPFLRTGQILECWHPALFYRGMDGIVHSILSEAGQSYIDRFSKLFERHVVGEARKLPARFYDEAQLKRWLPPDSEIPDGLISYPACNIYIESKAGMFDESVMTVGHSEIFAHKTKALQKAARQAWSASVGLRQNGMAPSFLSSVEKDYLLIITNKELSTSRGSFLAEMYPPGTFEPPTLEAKHHLPIEHIYVLSIEDFERLVVSVRNFGLDLPWFMDMCVAADKMPETSQHYVEQHLDRLWLPVNYSDLISDTMKSVTSRLAKAFGRDSIGC